MIVIKEVERCKAEQKRVVVLCRLAASMSGNTKEMLVVEAITACLEYHNSHSVSKTTYSVVESFKKTQVRITLV